jgi:L-fuconolactonase
MSSASAVEDFAMKKREDCDVIPATTPPSGMIDAHQHFWRYSQAEYAWIDDSMETLRRDFLPENLAPELAACGVGGVVCVQARQSLEETAWLLGFARRHAFIRGVVGWVPLVDPRLPEIVAPLAEDRKLVGARHVVQGEPDDDFILREDFNAGIRALRPLSLRYDILVFERHLPQTIRFVDRHPDQVFVLDHIAKPRIRERILSPWRENIFELSKRPNVYCKLSGLVTEADPANWSPADLAPYIDTVLEAFGPRRLMFGSDWPVCLLGVTYSRWLSVVLGALSGLSAAEQQRICSATAIEAYGLASV